MHHLEDVVGRGVAAPAIPPSLDRTFVVSIDSVVSRLLDLCDRCAEEKKTDCFCPANVPPFLFPAREEPPGSPTLANGDSNSNCRASIGESSDVSHWSKSWELSLGGVVSPRTSLHHCKSSYNLEGGVRLRNGLSWKMAMKALILLR